MFASSGWTKFFGLNSSMLAMLVMVILVGMGERLAERFLPLYILAVGGSAYAIGFLNAMQNFLGALYSFPSGYLSDRWGYKRALLFFTFLAMCGYAIVIFISTWEAVLIGAIFFIAWSAISLPPIMSLVSSLMPKEKRTMGVTMHSLIRRIPMALGPVLGGLLIGWYGTQKGIGIAFLLALVMAALALLFQVYFITDKRDKEKPVRFRESLQYLTPDLRHLLCSDILIRFAEQIPYAFVVVWVVNCHHISETEFGVLTAIEMATAVLIYLPVAYMADTYGKKPFVLITFGFFTLFPLVLLWAQSFWAFVGVFVIRGLKEFGEPTRKALIMDMAPEHAKAVTFGTYYLIRDVIVGVAALASAPLWNISPATNFITAFICGVAGTVFFALFGRDAKANGTIKT